MRCHLRLIQNILILLATLPPQVLASPGQLDVAFGLGGRVSQNIGIGPDESSASKILRQADGKLVVAGSCAGEQWRQICVVRYTAMDMLDGAFNGSGKRFMVFPGNSYASAVVELNAKLYVLGYCGDGPCLFRLNSDGSTDTAFGNSGVLTAFAGMSPSSMAVQGSQLVLAGACPVSTATQQCVLRMSTSGLPDTSFGSNGLVTTTLGIGDSGAVVVATSGDKVIVAGHCVFRNNGGSGLTFSTIRDICVTRYNPNGSLDGSFNGSGTAHYFLTNGHHWIAGLALDGDRIVVGGICDASPISVWQNPRVYCAIRAQASGALDTSFDGDGKVTLQLDSSFSVVNAVGLDGSRIVLAGNCQLANANRMCVVRFNVDGSLDTSLAGNGILRATGAVNGWETAHALLIEGDKLFLAGQCTAESSSDFCVVRFNRSGSPDGGRERLALGVKPLRDILTALHYQSDGKLLAVGYCGDGSETQTCLARFNADGSLDPSFNGTGRIMTALGGTARGHALVVSDGKITVAAECTSQAIYDYDFCVARFLADGSPDTGFGGSGIARVGIGPSHDSPKSITLDNGRTLINGFCWAGDSVSFCAVRLNADGTLDTSFNNGGTLHLPVGESGAITGRMLPINGKLYIAGICGSATPYICVARLLDNGTFDTTFGTGGRVVTGYLADATNTPGVTHDAQAIYVASSCIEMGQGRPCVTRIGLDGVIDATFAANARLPVASGYMYGGFSAVSVSNGRITAAGDCTPTARPCVARFLIDGFADHGFGAAGIQPAPLDMGSFNSMAVQASKVAVAGYCYNSRDLDFCLMQLQNQLPPDSPQLLQARGGNGSVEFFFAPPVWNGGDGVTNYRLACDNGGGAVDGSSSPLLLSGLTNGQSYQCALTASNAIGASEPIVVVLSPTNAPVSLLAVLSRKVHSAAGTFDIELNRTPPQSGAVTVEPRSAARPHLLVFQFSGPLTSVGMPVVVGKDGQPVGSATATIRDNDVDVLLDGIGQNRRVTVSLPAINATQGAVSVSLGFLTGDGNRSRSVNAADISGVKAQVGQTLGGGNFKFDFDASGSINATDVQAVKARAGSVLE